jgi:hypothetical protein
MDPERRSESLVEAADALWPEPLAWTGQHAGHRRSEETLFEYFVVPHLRSPRLLVPTDRRLAGRVFRDLANASEGRRRLVTRALAGACRVGLAGVLLRDRVRIERSADTGDRGIQDVLDDLLGTPVDVVVSITRARANRKPILRVVGADGETLAYAKVATTSLTKRLVEREGDVLERLAHAAWRRVQLPEVIGRRSWHGSEILLISALTTNDRQLQLDDVLEAAQEICRSAPVTEQPTWSSSYWRRLNERVTASTHARESLTDVMRTMEQALPDLVLQHGAWHGDWTPWNMAAGGRGVLVWDLERYEEDVPVGYDVVHYDLQRQILVPGENSRDAIRNLLPEVRSHLAAFGVPDPDPVVLLYLVEMCARWMADEQARVGNWGLVLRGMVEAAHDLADQLALRPSDRSGRGPHS